MVLVDDDDDLVVVHKIALVAHKIVSAVHRTVLAVRMTASVAVHAEVRIQHVVYRNVASLARGTIHDCFRHDSDDDVRDVMALVVGHIRLEFSADHISSLERHILCGVVVVVVVCLEAVEDISQQLVDRKWVRVMECFELVDRMKCLKRLHVDRLLGVVC